MATQFSHEFFPNLFPYDLKGHLHHIPNSLKQFQFNSFYSVLLLPLPSHAVLINIALDNIYMCVYIYIHNILFIYFWLCWLFTAGLLSRCLVRASYRPGFSCHEARALGNEGFRAVASGLSSCSSRALEHRLSSCSLSAQLLFGMWDPPGPGIEPMFLSLADGFSITESLRKSLEYILMISLVSPSPLLFQQFLSILAYFSIEGL